MPLSRRWFTMMHTVRRWPIGNEREIIDANLLGRKDIASQSCLELKNA
jgi:hypothetical protein